MYIVHKLNVHNYFIEAGLSVESFMANKSILLKMTFTLVIVSSETCYSCMSLVSFKSKFHTMRNVFSIMCSIQNYTTE